VNDLLQPWNLIFALPFGCALLLLILMTLGLLPHDTEAHTELGDLHNAGLDSFHIDHGIEAGHGGGGVGYHGPDHIGVDKDTPFLHEILGLFGFGRVPASLILMSFGFIWGFVGWASNGVLRAMMPPAVFIWPSLALAFIIASFVTRFMALTISRLIPASESYAISGHELTGKIATARFRITENSGTAQLYDRYGNLHEVSCRIAPGGEEIIGGRKVVLVSFDESKNQYRVRLDPLEERAPEANPQRLETPMPNVNSTAAPAPVEEPLPMSNSLPEVE
jgi:hypothetical protein